jgi:hypothetical protein
MAALGARAGLGLGAITCLAVAAVGVLALRRAEHGAAPARLRAQRGEPATVQSR